MKHLLIIPASIIASLALTPWLVLASIMFLKHIGSFYMDYFSWTMGLLNG